MDRHRTLTGLLSFSSRGGGSGVSRGGCGVMSITIDELDADLLGEGEFDLLASGGGQLGLAFGNGLGGILNLGDKDGPLLGEISTAHNGEGDGLVDTGLDGLGVGDGDGDIDGGDDGHVVSGFLSDLLAVVVSITTMSVSTISMVSGLADGDHLDVGLLLEGDLDSLGGGGFFFLFVMVRADLVVNLLDLFGADGAGHGVGELLIDDDLDGQFDIFADGLEGGGADLSDFSHIANCAVVLGFLVAITAIGGGVVAVGGSGVVAVGGGGVVGGGLVVGAIRRSGVGGAGGSGVEDSQNSDECLHDVFCLS